MLIATGVYKTRDLGGPGAGLPGIVRAIDYLTASNRKGFGDHVPAFEDGSLNAEGKHVVVIGGGDTGADCIGTAHRQGALSVTNLAIGKQPPSERPAEQPWPMMPTIFEVGSAHEEGGEREYAVSTSEILGEDGRVTGLRVTEVRRTEGGFEPVEGTERVIPAQLVLLAMGFVGPETDGVVEQLGLELDERGNIRRDRSYMTNVPGVFVAGDAGRGQSLIVWAIAEGRSAAQGVDAWLTGSSALPRPVNPTDRPLVV